MPKEDSEKNSGTLVLTRKVNNEIFIADNINIKVTQIKGGRVKLAITAPTSISIARKELLEK